MHRVFRLALLSALAFSPAAVSAQGLYMLGAETEQDPLVIQEPVIDEQLVQEQVLVEQPVVVEAPVIAEPMIVAPVIGAGPLTEDDAVAIAMMNGIASVEDVDTRMWDGDFEVEGTDAAGEDLEIRIDSETGEILEIDD